MRRREQPRQHRSRAILAIGSRGGLAGAGSGRRRAALRPQPALRGSPPLAAAGPAGSC